MSLYLGLVFRTTGQGPCEAAVSAHKTAMQAHFGALQAFRDLPNSPLLQWKCSGGGIGRHTRLRGVCRKACRFESCPEHQPSPGLRLAGQPKSSNTLRATQLGQKAKAAVHRLGDGRRFAYVMPMTYVYLIESVYHQAKPTSGLPTI